MTQDLWNLLSPAQKATRTDWSDINPQLRPYIGSKVRVTPPRPHGLSTFRVGKSTGWKPVLLAMKANENGSSDLINKDEVFTSVERI